VRSIFTAWERGDYSSADWADPEIEFVAVAGPTSGRRTGLAGMAEGWRDILGAWDDFRTTAEEYRELDGDRVIVLTHSAGRAKISGLNLGQTQSKSAIVFRLRDGKVTRLVLYPDGSERALADLGLPTEADSAESTRPRLNAVSAAPAN
jgi:ketosteroid isomerase-like protein